MSAVIRKIPTRTPLLSRIRDLMQLTWWPAIVIYSIGAAVFIAAMWGQL